MAYLVNSPTFTGTVTLSNGALVMPANKGITIPDGAPSTTAHSLYAVSGSLYFNGSAIGGGGGSVSTTDDNTSTGPYYPIFATTAGGSTLETGSTYLSYLPVTGTLIANRFQTQGIGTPPSYTNADIFSYDTYASWLQILVQNLSNDPAASSDLVATADTGTDTTYYIDLGINSSTYSQTGWTINSALDGYLYTQSSNLTIGTATAGKNLVLFTGGTLLANTRLTLSDTSIVPNVPIAIPASQGLQIASGVPSTTANTMYNNNGKLYFNGAAVSSVNFDGGAAVQAAGTTNYDFGNVGSA